MAHIYRTATGWRAQVALRGIRKSATKPTKAAASAWAAQEEAAILAGKQSKWPRKTVADALERYEAEVTVNKKSARAEGFRLGAFARDFPELSAKIISDVTAADLAGWRDARLKLVSPGAVQRDINVLRNVWSVAAKEWGWCADPSPWRSLRMPGDNPPRDKLIGWREARRILRRCDYRTGERPTTTMQEVGWAFLLGLRTAMRAGEIVGLTGESVDLARRVVRLDQHKTMQQVGRRFVPLTPHGLRLLTLMHRPGPLFEISSATLDTLFRRVRDQVLLPGINFHDSRAAALTYLARKVDVLTLSRISGHKNLQTLLKSYYRESAESVAARLAQPRR
jgi:integrase